MQKNVVEPYLKAYTRINTKGIRGLNVRAKIRMLLEEYVNINL